MTFVYRRVAKLTAWVMAAWFTVMGLTLLTADPDRFPPAVYDVTFSLMSRSTWGVVFLMAAAMFLLVRRPWGLAGMQAVAIAYAGCFLAASVSEGAAPTAWVPWALISTELFVWSARGGR